MQQALFQPLLVKIDNEPKVNPRVLQSFRDAVNPHIILIYGPTRIGKSSTLNNLINGCENEMKYLTDQIFESSTRSSSVTKGCDIYGPIKLSELLRRHRLETSFSSLDEDCDIFFAENEGFGSLNSTTSISILSILTLFPISSISCAMVNQFPISNIIYDIITKTNFSRLLNEMHQCDISDTIIFSVGNKLAISESLHETIETFQSYSEDIKTEIEQCISSNQFDRSLLDSLDVVVCGPFDYIQGQISQDDISLNTYWSSLKDLMMKFTKRIRIGRQQSGKDLAALTEIFFNFFKQIDINMKFNINLESILCDTLKSEFNDDIEKSETKLKQSLDANFKQCITVLKDSTIIRQFLIKGIESSERYEIYNGAIKEYIDKTMNAKILEFTEYANAIIEKYIKEYFAKYSSNEILSSITSNIVQIINSKTFQEEIDPQVYSPGNIDKLCRLKVSENNDLIEFMENKQKSRLEELLSTMKISCNQTINDALSTKPSWKTYLDTEIRSIRIEVSNHLIRILRNSEFKDEFYSYYSSAEQYIRENFERLRRHYFKQYYISTLLESEIQSKIKEVIYEVFAEVQKGARRLRTWCTKLS